MDGANAELWAQFDRMLTQYENATKELSKIQEKLPTLRGEADSEDHLVNVVVGPRGNLVELTIEPRAFRRLSPTELSHTIVELVERATKKVIAQTQDLLAPFLPKDIPLDDLMSGKADFTQFLPKGPMTPETFDEWWRQFGYYADSDTTDSASGDSK